MLRFKIIALLSLVIFINGCGEKRKTIYEEFDFSTLPKSVISNGEKIYMRACFACHNTGREGATLLTETRQWNRTAKKGIEILYQNVLQGYTGMGGVMPPKGNCWDCTEDDIRQAILYIYHQVKLAKK
ncbi:MAG: cytochrome c5 family protein [Candidatus Marinimicrobia bacterium]|jgi:cytochrome c5|nr:cytochrome c5 family protein [Candidatus Neomarinimicrobiota bacterium]